MKTFWLFLAVLGLPSGLVAAEGKCTAHWTLEVHGAYYRPSSKSFTKLYSPHLWDYQVEAARHILSYGEIWTGVHWASKRGHGYRADYDSGYTVKHTSQVYITPIFLGLKWVYPVFPVMDIYMGAAGCYSFLRIKNVPEYHDSYWSFSVAPLKKVTQKEALGGMLTLGGRFRLGADTFLSLFFDYYSQRFHLAHHRDLDCSGFKCGAGLGVYF